MRCVRFVLRALVALSFFAAAAHADDSLSPDTAARVKQATVYIKVAIGPIELFGSGFVVQFNGNSALIVTNHHVVSKPRGLAQGGYIPGLRGRDRIALHKLQMALAASKPVVTVVFNSGEPNEQALKAEVLCKLEDPDLAVLKVSSVNSAITPIEFRRTPHPVETMPVFMLGFPFGESLATNRGNPNITVGRGSVSSIRKDSTGKVVKVQIDGALNPGNSGGPVIDRQGNLMGIAVQTVQGSNIGLAIPTSELVSVFQGTLGRPVVTLKPGTNGAPKYDLLLPRVDPMNQLRSAVAHFVTKAVAADPTKTGKPQLLADSSSRKIDLSLAAGNAQAELPAGVSGGQQLTVQVSFVNGQGVTIYLEPQVITVPAPSPAPAGGVVSTVIIGPDGTTTTTVTQETPNGKGGASRRRTTVTRRSSSNGHSSAPRGSQKSAFKNGDKVRVAWGGKIQDAEVVHVDGNNGWVMVKFSQNGLEMTPTLPPDKVEMAEKSSRRPAAKSGDREEKVAAGDMVRVAWAGKIENAEVIDVDGNNGWATVKFRRDGIELTPKLPPDQIEVAAKKKTSSAKPGAKLRLWSSKGGKFKLKAKFVELKDGSVTLEKEGGSTVTVELSKLSDADQKAAREFAEQLEDDPFADGDE